MEYINRLIRKTQQMIWNRHSMRHMQGLLVIIFLALWERWLPLLLGAMSYLVATLSKFSVVIMAVLFLIY